MMKMGDLICVRCKDGKLHTFGDRLECALCGKRYPVLSGVPLLVEGVVIEKCPPGTIDADVDKVLAFFKLKSTPEYRQRVTDILSYRYTFPRQNYTAENNAFLNRISAERDNTRGAGPVAGTVWDQSRAAITLDYLPPALPLRHKGTHNLRVLNAGAAWLCSHGPDPVYLSYTWRRPDKSASGESGSLTAFPVPVAPGRTITVPVHIQAPDRPGKWLFCAELARGHGVRGAMTPWSQAIQILESDAFTPPPSWELSAVYNSYADDHHVGRELLRSWISSRRGEASILEIGGTSSPQSGWFGQPVWNVDIDVQSLQIGALVFEHARNRDCRFVCADAMDLPFEKASLEVIAMFSTLHHFEDPAAALRRLSGYLRPEGFLAVFCEPVGHNVSRPDYLAELRSGVNEQTFSLEEYAMMFQRAGLWDDEVVVHSVSPA